MYNDSIHEEKYLGKTIKLFLDEASESPRDWDNLCTLLGVHQRLNIFDEEMPTAGQSGSLEEDFFAYIYDYLEGHDKSWDMLTPKQAERAGNGIRRRYVFTPYSAYTKGGCILRVGYAHGWDCGVVGMMFCSRDDIKKAGLQTAKQAMKIMEAELDEFSQYCNGEVYCYEITDESGEDVESCGGFLGMDYALVEARSVIKAKLSQLELEV